ncbi:MAG TPA: asparaginase [Longimicrobiaceae bacterium]|nr:asparaginase [Longimicrobiaceae bacterium]
METSDFCVEVVRGAAVESRHRVHAAVVDADGRLRAWAGDPELVTFWRSAAKPFQALPLVDDGACERYGLTPAELAICCGSHSGSAAHTAAVESILLKAGVGSGALACGPHAPFDDEARRSLQEAGLEPGRLHNNCSGKHAGMMALARAHGWDPAGYERPEHPVQRRILAEVARRAQLPVEAIGLGTDGCGVVCFALPLRHMALAFAGLAAGARRGEGSAAAVVAAMTAHPEMVAGEGRICTDLTRRAAGRLFAKVGAEGVYCVGVPGAELGIAIKVEDGAARAVAPAIVALLRELDLISEDDFGALHAHVYPDLFDTRGEVVGQLRPRVVLRSPDA